MGYVERGVDGRLVDRAGVDRLMDRRRIRPRPADRVRAAGHLHLVERPEGGVVAQPPRNGWTLDPLPEPRLRGLGWLWAWVRGLKWW